VLLLCVTGEGRTREVGEEMTRVSDAGCEYRELGSGSIPSENAGKDVSKLLISGGREKEGGGATAELCVASFSLQLAIV